MKVVQTNGQLEEFNPNKILYKIKTLSDFDKVFVFI